MANFLFYLMAAAAVGAALIVVLARSAMTSVLALLVCFFSLATIYLLAGFQLLAAAQILVYAGAILVLFLFVIMLLDLGHVRPLRMSPAALFRQRHWGWVAAIAASFGVLGASAVLQSQSSLAALQPPAAGRIPAGGIDDALGLAAAMFGRHLLPFEAISLLLLATAVAVLVLAKRDRGAPSSRAGRATASGATTERDPSVLTPAPPPGGTGGAGAAAPVRGPVERDGARTGVPS